MVRATVDASDVDAQVRKLKDYRMVAQQEYVFAMQQVLTFAKVDIAVKAPVGDTGQLRGSTDGELRFAAGDEVRGVLTNSARGANGFPYPYALDASQKYHYRGKRRTTRRWFKGVLSRRRKDIIARFQSANDKIVARLVVKGRGA